MAAWAQAQGALPRHHAKWHKSAAITRLDRGAAIATARGKASDFVMRLFVRKLGLPEDPIRGTAHRNIVP
ncbi:MAG: hypothetical protein ACREEP_20420 [Dongiaceae bacterium]